MAAAQFWGGMSLREFSVWITFSYSKDTTLVNYIHEILIHSAAARGRTHCTCIHVCITECTGVEKPTCTGYLLIQYWVNLRLGFRWGMLTNCCSFFHVTTSNVQVTECIHLQEFCVLVVWNVEWVSVLLLFLFIFCIYRKMMGWLCTDLLLPVSPLCAQHALRLLMPKQNC